MYIPFSVFELGLYDGWSKHIYVYVAVRYYESNCISFSILAVEIKYIV